MLGEMGIGNTAASAMLMHGLTGKELSACVGRGTGVDDRGLERKKAVLAQALKRRGGAAGPVGSADRIRRLRNRDADWRGCSAPPPAGC